MDQGQWAWVLAQGDNLWKCFAQYATIKLMRQGTGWEEKKRDKKSDADENMEEKKHSDCFLLYKLER